MTGDHLHDDLQDALVLIGKVVRCQAAQADHGQDLFFHSHRNGDLTADHPRHLPVKALFGQLLESIVDDHRLP